MMTLSASLNHKPRKAAQASTKQPVSSTVIKTGKPCSRPVFQILDAISRRGMHDAGAIFGADIIARHDISVIFFDRQECVKRVIAPAQQILPFHAGDDFVIDIIVQHFVHQGFGHDQPLDAAIGSAPLHLYIVDILANSQRERWQAGSRAWSSRPADRPRVCP